MAERIAIAILKFESWILCCAVYYKFAKAKDVLPAVINLRNARERIKNEGK